MPIYEYICLKCNEKFSLLRPITASEDDANCPVCAASEVKKVISPFCCSDSSGKDMTSSMPSRGFSGGG